MAKDKNKNQNSKKSKGEKDDVTVFDAEHENKTEWDKEDKGNKKKEKDYDGDHDKNDKDSGKEDKDRDKKDGDHDKEHDKKDKHKGKGSGHDDDEKDDEQEESDDNGGKTPRSGGSGDDELLIGTEGNDRIDGEDGDDEIHGLAGNDRLEGGDGDDLLLGGDGNDNLDGDDGNDTLQGGAGNDNVDGDDGDDLLIYDAVLNAGSHDVYDGGDGFDTLRLVLSPAQAADPAILAEIEAFQAHLASGGNGKGKGKGKDTFNFHELGLTARDIEALEIEITGGQPNAAPTAVDDDFTVAEDTSLNLTASQLLGNDSDSDGDTLSITSVSNALNGSVSLSAGLISFTPDADYSGPASFEYTVSDGKGGSDTAVVNIVVEPGNDAPIATGDTVSTDEDSTLAVATSQLLANDSDPDGDNLTILSVSNAVNGSVVLVGNTINFTPDTHFNGNGSFDYTVDDGNGGSDTATVLVTVAAVNDQPVALDDAFNTDEDAVLNLTAGQLFANDTDVDGDSLSVSSVGNAVNGSVSLSGGSIQFTPTADFSGNASFEYSVSDGNGGVATALVSVVVNPVNDAPVATGEGFATDEDTDLVLNSAQLVVNDTDIEGDSLTVIAVGNATNGSVSLANGEVTFSPDTDFNGTASFEYTVSDGNGGTDVATVQVTVNPLNDAPVAEGDTLLTDEDSPLTISASQLASNDLDVDGDALVVTGVANPVNGSVVLTAGEVTFTPDPDFNGTASFDYTVDDGNGGTDTATASIIVNPVNDNPVAVDDVGVTDEDTPLALAGSFLLGNDSDIDGDLLSIVSVSGAVNGSVQLSAGNVLFTPDADFNGDASFDYTVSDGNGGTATASVSLTVNPLNDAPVAAADGFATDEDTDLLINGAQLVANDTDIEGDFLTVIAVGNAANGSVSLANGEVTFSPDTDFNGTASFEYTVSDGNGGTDTANVDVTVNPVNDAPIATEDELVTDEDAALTINASQLAGNDSDVDGDALTVTSVANPGNGTVVLSAGEVTFTPDPDFNGTASFDYTVDDGNGGTDTATATITVNPVNDNPLAVDDVAVTDEDTPLALTGSILLSNDSDIDGDPLNIESVANAVNGTVSLTAGNVLFTPDADFNGDASFDYTVSDGNGGTDTATVSLTVNAVNDAPVAEDDDVSVDEDNVLNLTAAELLANDSDVDLDGLTLTAVGNASNGSVSLVGGAIAFTPDADFNGDASFEYTVADGNGGSDTALVNVTVNPVNDEPIAADDAFDTDEDVDLVLDAAQLLDNDSDVDGDTLQVTSVGLATNGTVSLVGTTITFTPDPNYNGPASFEYTIEDGQGGSNTASVAINVASVNDAPVAQDDAFDVDENGVLTNSVALNDSDVDGDTLTFTVETDVSNGSLALNPDGSFTYTPIPEYFGADLFTYTVSDGNGLTDTATVAIDIHRAADVPTQVISEENVAESTTLVPLSIQALLAGFVNTEVLTVTVAGIPAGASLNKGSDNGDGSYTLQPADLNSLSISLPAGTTGTVPLVVTTTADDGGPVSTQTAVLNINFGAAGVPEIVTGLGGDRDDTITGGSANDFLSGGNGDDLLRGNIGDDIIIGGAAYDRAAYSDLVQHYTLSTSNGLDFAVTDLHLTSGGGNDGTDQLSEIEGLTTANFSGDFTGPAVNGVLQMTSGNDIAVGYGTFETVDYTGAVTGTNGITINLSQAGSGISISTGQSGVDLLRNITNITGSEFNDNITGDANANILSGGDGNDTLRGNHGDDTIVGGSGHDRSAYNDLVQHYSIVTADGSDFTVTDLHLTSGSGNDGTDQLTQTEGMITANFSGDFTAPAVNGLLQMTSGNDIVIGYGTNVTADYTGAVTGTTGITVNLSQANSGVAISTGQSGVDLFRNIFNITGSEFNDSITGNGQDNILSGGAGNDTLKGDHGEDTIIGGAGHDRAQYNDLVQHYSISTTDGADFQVTDVHLTSGFGDDGTDQLTETEGMITSNFSGDFTAPAVNGVMQMTAGNDIVVGYGTNLTADYTGAVTGTVGVTVNLSQGDSGVAISTGQSGVDLFRNIPNIIGSEFNDSITGNGQDNILSGGAGNDTLKGDHGTDTIIGGAGHDRAAYNDLVQHYAITTTDGSDFVVTDINTTSGAGDDGTDQLTETEGMITSSFTGDFTGPAVGGVLRMTSGNDIAVGYGSNVTADYTGAVTGTTGITVNLSQGDSGVAVSTGQSGTDLFRNIFNITGSEFNDSITGNAQDNILSGGAGNDTLKGDHGTDTIIGGAGHDRAAYNDLVQHYAISTTDGSDFTVTDVNASSGSGNDGTDQLTQTEGMITSSFTGDFTGPAVGGKLQMTSGNDIAIGYGANVTADYTGAVTGTTGITVNLLQGVSGVAVSTGQSGTDLFRNIFNITGSEFNDTITGNASNNILAGGDGDDTLRGGLGDDTIVGDAGHDHAAFADLIQHFSLSTSDGLNFEVTDTNLTSGGGDEGTNQLSQTEGMIASNFTGDFVAPALGGVFQMTSGNDIVVSYGGNVTIDYTGAVTGTTGISLNLNSAASGASIGTGQSGVELLRGIVNIIGSEFNDSITGDSQGNVLDGGEGNDSLFAGNGDDVLIGGIGNDSLSGQNGNDRFVFNDGDGTDTVNGFVAGAGTEDVIDFAGVAALNSFGDVQAAAVQQGANTEISYAGGTVILVGVLTTSLSADDFLF